MEFKKKLDIKATKVVGSYAKTEAKKFTVASLNSAFDRGDFKIRPFERVEVETNFTVEMYRASDLMVVPTMEMLKSKGLFMELCVDELHNLHKTDQEGFMTFLVCNMNNHLVSLDKEDVLMELQQVIQDEFL